MIYASHSGDVGVVGGGGGVVMIRRAAVSHPLGYVWFLCFSIIPSFAGSFVCQLLILI